MEKTYAQALWTVIEKGMEPSRAVQMLHDVLEKRGRAALWPRIARAFHRLAEKEQRKNTATLIVADKSFENEARKQSEARDAELVVDENIIGGWRFEGNEQLTDASFRKSLLELYERSTGSIFSATYSGAPHGAGQ